MVDKFTLKDIPDINDLGSTLNENFTNLFHINDLPDNELIYVYKENDKVLGFIHILINYETVELLNIIVHEKYRNKKIATILMDYMITALPTNAERIILEVNETNIKAISLYNKFNFIEINRRKKYYRDNDAIIMERRII